MYYFRSGLDHVAFYQISKDMAVGMNYLHRHKPGPVLHLDLKSMNVLLDGYGRAKIGDFGFSKLKLVTFRVQGSPNSLSLMNDMSNVLDWFSRNQM